MSADSPGRDPQGPTAQSRREVLLRELKLRALRNNAMAQGTAQAPARIPRVQRRSALPLSGSQQRLWFIDRLDPEAGAAYHIPCALQLSGRLDRGALQAALDRVMARHEVLRTCFPHADGQPFQQIASAETGLALREEDLAALPEAQREAALARILAEEGAAAFDLASGLPIRARLLRLAEREHVLLLTQHHIVSDGWSVGVLIGEIATLYRAFSLGQQDPLPPLSIQYADYAAWQRGGGEADHAAALAFWKQRLAGAPELLELPLDRPRAALRANAGGETDIVLPPSLAAALRGLAQAQGATLFMVLLAGWALLLSRLSGQDDIVVGTPIANRTRAELEPMLGFFANTLALRIRLDPEMRVADLLAAVRRETLAAYEHQALPFEEVVEAVNPRRSTAHSPLFQTTLSLNNTPREAVQELPELAVRALPIPSTRTPFDLSLSLGEQGEGGIAASLRYASALFDAATVRRWLDYYLALLQEMASVPQRAIAQLPLTSAEQGHALLQRFNPPPPRRAQDLLHAVFERSAAAKPEATALIVGDRQFRFGTVDALANGVAHRLVELGVRRGDRVALCMERGAGQMIGLLAVLKAGAAYVPLDSAQPAERLRELLRDCRPAALLAGAATRVQLSESELPILRLDGIDAGEFDQGEPDEAMRRSQPPEVAALGPDDAAYVIYTSGSTGRPKGVVIEHGAILSLGQALQEAIYGELPGQARVALNASLVFDASLFAILQWLSGHTLVIVPEAVRADAPAMGAFLREQRIDQLDCTPAQVQALLEGGAGLHARVLLVGGEAISPALWRRLAALPGTRAYNCYGPTECSVCATTTPIRGEAVSIGTPLANSRVYILDPQGRPLPPGVRGEIHIGGAGVARGYLDRADLTAQRFIADPFAEDAQVRMYCSGDLGYWRDDGSIVYLGRNDFQVKLRGYRIELGEIEARLGELPGVREAVVLLRHGQGSGGRDGGDARLVAYLLADGAAPLNPLDLRRRLSALLPDYMLPAAFVSVSAWPLTVNGKIDRAALPVPDAQSLAAAEFQAPATATEQRLARIFGELLHTDCIGRDDNFFDLGGHSLLATRLVTRIADEFSVEIALMQVFQAVTLAELAAVIDTARTVPTQDGPAVQGEMR